MIGRHAAGFVLIAAGIAAGIAWAGGRMTHPFSPVLALLLFLAGASFFGKTSRFADKLRPLVGQSVRVRVWGSELPDHAGSRFSVHMVRALGAGLHLYLRPLADGSPMHLKVAQPFGAIAGDSGFEISHAKYVQWDGRKIKKDEREKALVLVVETD